MAELAAPKACTWESASPMRFRAARNWPSGAGPGVTTSISVPPAKSMPRFRPWVKKATHAAMMASAEIAAAKGASRTKSMCVLLGR